MTRTSPQVVLLTILLTGEEVAAIGESIAPGGAPIEVWLLQTSLREAWKVIHRGEHFWPYCSERIGIPSKPIELAVPLVSFEGLAESARELFFWQGSKLVLVDVPQFIAGSAARALVHCRTSVQP